MMIMIDGLLIFFFGDFFTRCYRSSRYSRYTRYSRLFRRAKVGRWLLCRGYQSEPHLSPPCGSAGDVGAPLSSIGMGRSLVSSSGSSFTMDPLSADAVTVQAGRGCVQAYSFVPGIIYFFLLIVCSFI